MRTASAPRPVHPPAGDRRRHPGRFSAAAAVALAAAASVACAPDRSPAPRAERPEDTAVEEDDLPPARYVTALSFLAGEDPPSGGALPEARVMWFTNRTSPAALRRTYRGWDGGGSQGGWRPVLEVTDSLPFPRAGWRPLPTEGLRIRILPDGELAGLTVRAPAGRTRLDLGPALATWRGSTGQQENLRRAVLSTDSTSLPGVTATLRFNRLAEEGGPFGPGRLLLVAAADGSGVAALADPARHAPWNRVITWSDSGSDSWPALEPAVRLDSVARGEAWSFRIRDAGISGRIEWTERRTGEEETGELVLLLGHGRLVSQGRPLPARALYVHREPRPLPEPPD